MATSEVVNHQTTSGFWREDLWLPQNVTWKQTQDFEGFPREDDLLCALPIAVILLVLRWFVEQFIAEPVGIFMGLEPDNTLKLRKVELEKLIIRTKGSHPKVFWPIICCFDWILAEFSVWQTRRKQSKKISVLKKFRETGWRFIFYTFTSIFGLAVLWNKSWFWDINHCWDDLLSQSLTADIWWYYMIEIGFNISVMISQIVVDNKRKDFWMAIVHHLVSLLLLSMSWFVNGVRIGSLVLICHDLNDPFVEAAKAFIYIKQRRAANIAFGLFTIVWIILRIGVYPFHLVLNAYLYGLGILGPLPAWTIFFIMLALILMHVVWTYMILRMGYRACKAGEVEDSRSDTDEDRTEDVHQLENYFNESQDEGQIVPTIASKL